MDLYESSLVYREGAVDDGVFPWTDPVYGVGKGELLWRDYPAIEGDLGVLSPLGSLS